MISKAIKSIYTIYREIFSQLGFQGIKRLTAFFTFAFKLSLYVWFENKDFLTKNHTIFSIAEKFDPLLKLPKPEREVKRAKWVLEQILELGSTFIKLGQVMSTRADLIPLTYMKELAKLQDEIPPFDDDLAFKTIQEELKKPLTSIFAEVDKVTLASGSLGQVYRAKLLDSNKEVIIKVQKPDLRDIIEQDIFILRTISKEASKYPELVRGTDFESLLDEFLKVLHEEIDYIQEGKSCDHFRKNFKGYYRVYVPKVYWQYTTRKVITLEYIKGYKITEKEEMLTAGMNLKEITREGCNIYLKQLLTDGFFHADPHPGNLRIMEDGRLAFFDFGMVGHVSKELQIKLVNTMIHLISKDYRGVVEDFAALGLLDKNCTNLDDVAKDIKPLYDARFESDNEIKASFKQILEDMAEIVYKYKFRLPVELALIIRALLTLEGLGHSLDPDFNVIRAFIPFIQRYMFTKEGAWLREHITDKLFSGSLGLQNPDLILRNNQIIYEEIIGDFKNKFIEVVSYN
jgi:predicted unusual protein kinase regulating ubiquinone biosynthesis (AarF/ABC1/UbiB family)